MASKKTPRKNSATALRPGSAQAASSHVVVVRPDVTQVDPPVVVGLQKEGNLFSSWRAGRAVLRPDDLLALRVQWVNLSVVGSSSPRLKRNAGAASACLILHLPPQAIAEEVFWEITQPGVDKADTPPPAGEQPPPTPPGDNSVDPPPIRARAAGESRLVFDWPAGFECDYTLAGILQAVQQLSLKVPPGARARPLRQAWSIWPGALSRRSKATAAQPQAGTRRSALGAFGLRQTLIAQAGGSAAEATLQRRLTGLQPAWRWDVFEPPVVLIKPKPADPLPQQTALELPWRLVMSPHAASVWRHANEPVQAPGTERTELWHTRLIGRGTSGIEPPHADAQRTLRAVWARGGPSTQPPMQAAFPGSFAELPEPDTLPFRATLNDYDRYQLVHLSSNFSMNNYQPQPIDTRLLLLSSLGGWLDCRGDWEPPGLDVESWVHRATMGRDHYVRVVYRGVLFPFGHRAVLIKVSERKFHPGLPGNPAYLRQRMFLVVRERVKSYADAASLKAWGDDDLRAQHEFPFSQVRMLTTVTPDLAPPENSQLSPPSKGQMLFWPATGSGPNPTPFRFRMQATDLDGRAIDFDLPLIFMSNSMASPRTRDANDTLQPWYVAAALCARQALTGWVATQTHPDLAEPNANDRTVAAMKRQRIAMAVSGKAGDTAIECISMSFSAHVPANVGQQPGFESYSNKLLRPMFFPKVVRVQARLAALAQLTGSEKFNKLAWNPVYAKFGFDGANNKGEVFLDVVKTPFMAELDFSKQGDRSGGFVMPNLSPSCLSRALGPAAGDVGQLLLGRVVPTQFFPPGGVGELPLPLLFGCIPLSAIIDEVGDLLGQLDKAPKFASEASTKVESFFAELMRLYQLITALASQPASFGEAALEVVKGTLNDLVQQAAAFGAAQAGAIGNKVNAVQAPLNTLRIKLASLSTKGYELPNPLAGIDLNTATLQAALTDLKSTVGAAAQIPAGYRQSVNELVTQAQAILAAVALIPALTQHGKALFDALRNLLYNDAPGQSIGELLTKPAELGAKVQTVADRLGDVRADVEGFPLLDGPARQTIVSTLGSVQQALGTVADVLALLESLLGEELVVRFDWKPPIKSWSLDGSSDYLFKVHDKQAFIVAVEARVKKSGGPPKIQVLCGLRNFDLVLIAPASFIELNFEKIEFTVDTAAKMNVDVLLSDIKFVGPLSFVETLRDLIPLDGFSDPPYLDITAQGIDAGFDIALPTIACGVLNLSNVSLGAGFTVPFIGQPLSVRFNFCTREQPFHLTVYCFGGGGFFGVTLDPRGVQILEAAFEFGAAISVDFGVASGGVSVMAGIYFRMEGDAASLTGYFRLEGHVDVLGLITASLELYLELRYEFETGKAVGMASLTIEVEVLIFSGSVTIRCEKKFSGSNGDPTFRQLLGLSKDPLLPLADELTAIQADTQYGWRDYCEAFA
jgi:hypothetical protein